MDKFYCCYVEGTGGNFSHKHLLWTAAMGEAERLARKEGKKVYILEAVRVCEPFVPEPPANVKWSMIQD